VYFATQWFADKPGLSDRALQASVAKLEADAHKAAMEASKIAAEADAQRQESFKVFASAIDEHFGNDSMATQLKIAKLLETNPELEIQLKKVQAIAAQYEMRVAVIDPTKQIGVPGPPGDRAA